MELDLDNLEEMDLNFDENWILEAEKEETSFSRFYKSPVKKIVCYSLFTDSSKNVIKLDRQYISIEKDNTLSQTELLNIIKTNNINLQNYRIEHILNFNFDINQTEIQTFINDYDINKVKNLFLKEVSYTSDIKFNDTINYLHSLNSIFLIYKEKTRRDFKQNMKLNKNKKFSKKNIHIKINENMNKTRKLL